MTTPIVRTLYHSNIDDRIIEHQKSVFDYLDIPLEQCLSNETSHGEWLDKAIHATDTDLLIFCDIDAFPVSRDAFDKMIAAARSGAIVGLAHVANHLDPSHLYAGPIFLAFRRDIFESLGSPSLQDSRVHDVAQILTVRAEEAQLPLQLIMPNLVLAPRWALADKGILGIGTFYGSNGFFHLFQSRYTQNIELFVAVAQDVVANRIDYDKYLGILNQKDKVRSKHKYKRILKALRDLPNS